MTEKEAINFFEKAYTLQEQWKLENDIQDISNILNHQRAKDEMLGFVKEE